MKTIQTNDELQKINSKIIEMKFTHDPNGLYALLVVADEQDTILNDYEFYYIPLTNENSFKMCSDFLYQQYLKESDGFKMVYLISLILQCSALKKEGM